MPVRSRKEGQSALKRFRVNFVEKRKPLEDVKLPDKISSLSSEKLSDLQNHYSAWREFTEDLLIDALAESVSTRIKYDHEYNVQLIQNFPRYKTKTEAESQTKVNVAIHNLFLSLSEAELYYDLLTRKFDSYNNCLATISREITRRTTV